MAATKARKTTTAATAEPAADDALFAATTPDRDSVVKEGTGRPPGVEEKTVKIAITPEIAEEYLSHNTHNRALTPSKVDRHVRTIQRNEWMTTHQGVALDWNGNLLDGQHRLRAIVESGRTVTMYVTTGMDPATFAVIDTGKNRSATDALHVEGYGSASKLSAVGRLIALYEWQAKVATQRTGPVPLKAFRQENSERVAMIDNLMPKLLDYVHMGTSVRSAIRGASASAGAAAMYLIEKAGNDTKYTHDFYHFVLTGENLDGRHPATALRSYLIRKDPGSKGAVAWHELALWIMVWNDYVHMRPRRVLQFRADMLMPKVEVIEDAAFEWHPPTETTRKYR